MSLPYPTPSSTYAIFIPHWFRHAHVTHAQQRGAPIALVRDTLGHTSIATTGRYSHANPETSSGEYLPI